MCTHYTQVNKACVPHATQGTETVVKGFNFFSKSKNIVAYKNDVTRYHHLITSLRAKGHMT